MVDEAAFRAAWARLDALPCPFSRALLAGHADCRHAHRHHLAERVAIGCLEPSHQVLCAALLERLRHEARFALEVSDARGRLTHGQAMKLQVGCLRGLRRLLADGAGGDHAGDVTALFAGALARYDTLDAVPHEAMLREIARFVPRRSQAGR
ncbi:MAG: hypothetical protein R3298_03815 [Gammaproteobacteria bacterium]|nr:hypothetical protein [Gammaproteobacteria bacterium]